ncbi:hypothetical protein J2T55_001761 [Methylohalomonas lacus]|uniref:DUF3566 domain-containing protein n=1 Tax=Methylohalomonas lacus TaxID=398773 RepID=A0AAE3L1K7_9GAMM|nr:hypothetical protein [Methylohalomonas lacus]MCS3903730.1 hypothetical protein [Methylohalomonas lacus]
MKQQIRKLALHQNAKVMAVWLAVSSLIFLLPMLVVTALTMPLVDQNGNPIEFPLFVFLLMPFFYLVFGYISIVIGCLIYNLLATYIGGIEFELTNSDEQKQD